jgi:hypothetical protein
VLQPTPQRAGGAIGVVRPYREDVDDRSAVETTAGTGQTGQPPGDDGVGGDPLRPSERARYETDDSRDTETVAAGPSSRPGIAIGLILLAVFLAILVWAIVAGLR